jgi:hypothetical protein
VELPPQKTPTGKERSFPEENYICIKTKRLKKKRDKKYILYPVISYIIVYEKIISP